jgi:hypothetical protein
MCRAFNHQNKIKMAQRYIYLSHRSDIKVGASRKSSKVFAHNQHGRRCTVTQPLDTSVSTTVLVTRGQGDGDIKVKEALNRIYLTGRQGKTSRTKTGNRDETTRSIGCRGGTRKLSGEGGWGKGGSGGRGRWEVVA